MRSIFTVAVRLGVILGFVLALASKAAWADVVAVVSASNPVSTLSRNQAANIFLGRSTHFPDGSEAVAVDQSEGTAARDEFYAEFTSKSPALLKAHWSKVIFTGRGQPPNAVANDSEVKKFIAAHPHAIGYIHKSNVDAGVKILIIQ